MKTTKRHNKLDNLGRRTTPTSLTINRKSGATDKTVVNHCLKCSDQTEHTTNQMRNKYESYSSFTCDHLQILVKTVMQLACRFIHSRVALQTDIMGAFHPGGSLRFLLLVAVVQPRRSGNSRPSGRSRGQSKSTTYSGGRHLTLEEVVNDYGRGDRQQSESVPWYDRDVAKMR